MRNLVDLMTVAPDFFFKKLLKAPRDEQAPRGFHASLLPWDTVKKAPHLYLALYENQSIGLLARTLETVGDSFTVNVFELEFPHETTHQDYSYTYTGVWNLQSRVKVEMDLRHREAILVAYELVPGEEDSQCFVLRTPFVRLVSTTQYEITMIKQPQRGKRVTGSTVFVHDPQDFLRCFEIQKVGTEPAEEVLV